MAIFVEGMRQLANYGLLDALLPFMLIFTLIFAIAEKVKPFGESKKKINVIMALIIALMVVLPHIMGTYPAGKDVVVIINNAIPNVSVVIVAIIALFLLIGVFGHGLAIKQSGLFSTIAILGSIGAIVYIFGQSAGWWGNTAIPPFLGFLNDPDTQALLIVVAVFVIIISYVTGDDKGGTNQFGTTIKSLGDQFKNLLK